MVHVHAVTLAAIGWLSLVSPLSAEPGRLAEMPLATLTQAGPTVAARLSDLIDAALRHTPNPLTQGKGTPRPFEPLHWIAITNDAGVMEKLLSHGADPNARDDEGRTPLMVAAAFDSRAVADVLLAHGADPLVRDEVDGNMSLDFAAMAGHVDFVRLLMAHKVPVNGRATRNGETPLHYAAFYGRRKVIDVLVESGADINAADYSGVRPLQYARRRLQGLAVDLLMDLGARPDDLHDAVNAGDVARVRTLIVGGADVNVYDLSGTPLHLAAATGQVWIAAMLINAGADIEAEGEPLRSHPLHLAAIGNHLEAARFLLDRGAEVDSRDALGRTPLAVAATYGNAAVAEELILRAADVMAADSVYFDTPLHCAAMSGSIETADLLLSHGVDVNSRSGHGGEPPLNYAARSGNVEMVSFLLARGADLNMRDDSGRTPLKAVLAKAIGPAVPELLRRLGAEE